MKNEALVLIRLLGAIAFLFFTFENCEVTLMISDEINFDLGSNSDFFDRGCI